MARFAMWRGGFGAIIAAGSGPAAGRGAGVGTGGVMAFAGIASSAGTTISGIEELIRTGGGSAGLASTIGTTPASITHFINGQAAADIAAALGTTPGAAQELRNRIGREGAIGLIIGLACGLGRRQAER